LRIAQITSVTFFTRQDKTTFMKENEHHKSTSLASFELNDDGTNAVITLKGDWRHHGVENVCVDFPVLAKSIRADSICIDVEQVTNFDTAGAWLIKKFETYSDDLGKTFKLTQASDRILQLLSAIPKTLPIDGGDDAEIHRGFFHKHLRSFGMIISAIYKDVTDGLNILGSAIRGSQLKASGSAGASPAAIVTQLDHIGVRAVPIVILMSLAIGAIITQQAAFQLRAFGAEVFAVDLVSVLQLREVGVLITSIMIAGRSGSAITAEIGSMKMREEVDALKVMGLNPVGVLIFPRLIALVIALPLLTIVANFAALFSSAMVLYLYSDVPFNVFLVRMRDFADYTTLTSGMIKTPFMALMIGIVAAVEGMKVGGSAESLGRRVTAAVVKSIFLVIVLDGIFAIFYAAIDF
jgi:phospholipid/cholesterol/gamma-HCH transport system permease protein